MNTSYDTEAIYNNLDIGSLIDLLNIPTQRKGQTVYMACPNPDHFEKRMDKPDHCKIFYDSNSCHCFSCGISCNCYGIVKNWMEKEEGQILNGKDIYKILAEAAGGEFQYIVKGKNTYEIDKFPLSKDELEVLGMSKTNYSTVYKEVSEENGEMFAKTVRVPQISIMSLWKEDKEAFKYIVQTIAKQRLEKNEAFAQVFRTSTKEDGQILAQAFNKNVFALKQIMTRLNITY